MKLIKLVLCLIYSINLFSLNNFSIIRLETYFISQEGKVYLESLYSLKKIVKNLKFPSNSSIEISIINETLINSTKKEKTEFKNLNELNKLNFKIYPNIDLNLKTLNNLINVSQNNEIFFDQIIIDKNSIFRVFNLNQSHKENSTLESKYLFEFHNNNTNYILIRNANSKIILCKIIKNVSIDLMKKNLFFQIDNCIIIIEKENSFLKIDNNQIKYLINNSKIYFNNDEFYFQIDYDRVQILQKYVNITFVKDIKNNRDVKNDFKETQRKLPFKQEDALNICSQTKDCFNCSSYITREGNPICGWSNGRCGSVSNSIFLKNWWNLFDNCNDVSSTNISNTYCGRGFNKIPATVELQESYNDRYSLMNLYCMYEFIIDNNNSPSVYVQYSRSVYFQDLFTLEVFQSDGTKNYKTFTELFYNWTSVRQIFKIRLHYYSSSMKNQKPFSVFVGYEDPSFLNYLGLLLSIGILSFICFVGALIFYVLKKLVTNNQNVFQNPQNVNQLPQQMEIVVENSERLRQNKLLKYSNLLDDFLKNELKSVFYSEKENEYSCNCTICLENFKEKSEVNILSCHHIFHHSCLKDWLFKNVLMVPKCPNCNLILSNKWNDLNNEINRESFLNIDRNNLIVPGNDINRNIIVLPIRFV